MKMISLVLGLGLSGMAYAAAAETVTGTEEPLSFGCHQTRAGCPPQVAPAGTTFEHLLLEKLPLVTSETSFDESHGAAIKSAGGFTIILCSSFQGRAGEVVECNFITKKTSDGLSVLTPLEFLTLLNSSN
jgi:hypothetical protein